MKDIDDIKAKQEEELEHKKKQVVQLMTQSITEYEKKVDEEKIQLEETIK